MLRKAGRGEFRALLQGRRLYLRARRDGAEEDTLGWRPRLVQTQCCLGGLRVAERPRLVQKDLVLVSQRRWTVSLVVYLSKLSSVPLQIRVTEY